jgi:WD40 repeat protein
MPNGSRLVQIVPTEVTIANPVQGIRFLPNTTILVAMTDGTLYFWDVESSKLLQRIRNNANNIAIAISPDGTTIALSDQQQIELLNSNGAKNGKHTQRKFDDYNGV